MALRRSRVRIPLGPHNVGTGLVSVQLKVMAGVVGHPVSEKGKQGGSPSMASNGNARTQDRTRLFLARETSSVNLSSR